MRPIDADALKDELELADFETDSRMFGGQAVLFEDSVFKIVDSAPTLSPDDVRGMVHGTWVGIDDFPHESWECDRCGCVVENTDDPWNYFHYCPNCGARMKGAEDGTTDNS